MEVRGGWEVARGSTNMEVSEEICCNLEIPTWGPCLPP
jgi:hypothetical protein